MLVLYFLKSVLVKNPIKLSLIVVSLFLIYLIVKVDDSVVTKPVISQFTYEGKYHYIIPGNDSYVVKSFSDPIEVINSKISYKETHLAVILSSIVLFLIVICLFLASIGIDDSTTWDFKDCYLNAKVRMVKCELEDDYYYYHYKGKLILISDRMVGTSTLERRLSEPNNIYPDFPGTKEQRRDKKLKELLNES
jgi:hypothetical protein